MKPVCLFILFITCLSGHSLHAQPIGTLPEPSALTKNFMSWWSYYNQHTRLSADFIAQDSSRKGISKEPFFDSLITGRYIPVKRLSKGLDPIYQLFPIGETLSSDTRSISSTIANVAYYALAHFRMLGKELPGYRFTDLTGITYTNENTKGKILVIKCWFINCAPCIAEMPALNKLVNGYSTRKDILFVSIAFDQSKALQEFLAKTDFRYAVVPDKQSWLMDTANITNYPTHIIVNSKGIIVKVLETEEELREALQKITATANKRRS